MSASVFIDPGFGPGDPLIVGGLNPAYATPAVPEEPITARSLEDFAQAAEKKRKERNATLWLLLIGVCAAALVWLFIGIALDVL